MLGLGLKKSLSSLRLELTAQGMAQYTNDWGRQMIHQSPILIY